MSLDLLIEEDGGRYSYTLDSRISPVFHQAELVGEPEPFIDEVNRTAGLTGREIDAASWVISGNSMTGDWAVRMGQSLGIARDAARKAWSRARHKLRRRWATEPYQARSGPLGWQRDGPMFHPIQVYPSWWEYYRPRFETWTSEG